MSLEVNLKIEQIKELQEKIKKEKERYKIEERTKKMLYKKGLNPLIQPSYIGFGIYKEYKSTITFEPQSMEEVKTILKIFPANMYFETPREHIRERKFILIDKKTECQKDNIKVSSYMFRVSKLENYSEKWELNWVYKYRNNLYLFTIKLPQSQGHYRVEVQRDYKNRIISKSSSLIITNENIANKYKKLTYGSSTIYKDYKLYSDFTFLNILEVLQLKNIKTIDDYIQNKDFSFLINHSELLKRYINYGNKFKNLKFDIYTYSNECDEIYLKTEYGSLYVPVRALLQNDIKQIIKRNIDYFSSYYKNNSEQLQKALKPLKSKETKQLFKLLFDEKYTYNNNDNT